MKRTKLIATSTILAVVVGGSTIMANIGSTPEPVAPTVSEVKPAEATPAAEVVAPTPEPQVQAPKVQPAPTPVVVDPCTPEERVQLAPLQAKLDENAQFITKRTADLTELYNARKGAGIMPEGVTLQQFLDYDLNQTLRPVRATLQNQYSAEATKLDC